MGPSLGNIEGQRTRRTRVICRIQQPDARGYGPSPLDKSIIGIPNAKVKSDAASRYGVPSFPDQLRAAQSDGLRRICAVIHDDCREPLAAILVSGEAGFVPHDRLSILGKPVQEVAAELTVTVDGMTLDAKSL